MEGQMEGENHAAGKGGGFSNEDGMIDECIVSDIGFFTV